MKYFSFIIFNFISIIAISQNIVLGDLININFDNNFNQELILLLNEKDVAIIKLDSTGREPFITFKDKYSDSATVIFYRNKISSIRSSFSNEAAYISAIYSAHKSFKLKNKSSTCYPNESTCIDICNFRKSNFVISISRIRKENTNDKFEIIIYNRKNGLRE